MPELKHTFTSGKMDKDLDERLIPNGTYVDAVNVQVGSSESGDLGAIENVLGNTRRSTLPGLTNPSTVGSIHDNSKNLIYWLITSDNVDCIAEYSPATGVITPVLVDTNGVLNFSVNNHITGINILDDMLMWTDNLTEPKKINISTFKDGSTSGFGTHTQVYGHAFQEKDVTVVKRGPRRTLTVSARSTLKSGTTVGTGVEPVFIDYDFTTTVGSGATATYAIKKPGELITGLTVNNQSHPNWAVGDVISLKSAALDYRNFETDLEVRIVITAITVGTSFTVDATISSISPDVPSGSVKWSCVYEEDSPIFEKRFPRFAYRWKYADGEYSPFSPFTQPVFNAGEFKYRAGDGHNLGMTNNVRTVTLSAMENPPEEVIEVELIYSNAGSAGVFVVEKSDIATTSFTVTSEIIDLVVGSDQLTRVWDAVPRKAKAQDITGNRVLYGNYTEGYNMTSGSSANKLFPVLSASVTNTSHPQVDTGRSSIKSIRSYQVGVVYGDKYNRESPVFTSSGAAFTIPKANAKDINTIRVSVDSDSPLWATYFKYYIKDVSNYYYNLALDRLYKADDGNVWLSFASAERNKLLEDDYLILKKRHNDSGAVSAPAKFRVLDISNTPPTDLTVSRKLQIKTGIFTNLGTLDPQVGQSQFSFRGPEESYEPNFVSYMKSGAVIRLSWGSGSSIEVTDYYKVRSVEIDRVAYPTATPPIRILWTVTLDTSFSAYETGLTNIPSGGGVDIEIYSEETENKPEFEGKFFVKIHRDPGLEENIINQTSQLVSSWILVASSGGIALTAQTDPTSPPSNPQPGLIWKEHANAHQQSLLSYPIDGQDWIGVGVENNGYVSATVGGNTPLANPTDFNLDGSGDRITKTNISFYNDYLVPGQYVRFVQDPSFKRYEIKSVDAYSTTRDGDDGDGSDFDDWDMLAHKKITFTEPVTGTWATSTPTVAPSMAIDTPAGVWVDQLQENDLVLASPNPAVFETEPADHIDVDLYFEASGAYYTADHGQDQTLDWSNCYSFGNGVESDRIRDDFNALRMGKGIKASMPVDEPYAEENKTNGLIFSGIYNSTRGVNNLNQFSLAEGITKDLNPEYGSIQKIHVRDTDAIVLCEDKVLRVLANKDALYNADGNTNVTSSRAVLGTAMPYVGEFGISTNPESFAQYGFRAYFADKSRGVVIRLSRDGLTPISTRGLTRWFATNLTNNTGNIIGSYDEHNGSYNISLDSTTVSFKENTLGWESFKTFVPESGLSLNDTYYTFKGADVWSHDNAVRNTFYGGALAPSTITVALNDSPSAVKRYSTIGYEGSTGWSATAFLTDLETGGGMTFTNKEGKWFSQVKGATTTWTDDSYTGNIDFAASTTKGLGTISSVTTNASNNVLTFVGVVNESLQPNSGDKIFAERASGIYTVGECIATTPNTVTVALPLSPPSGWLAPVAGEFAFFVKNTEVNTGGLAGYHAKLTLSSSESAMTELFAVNSRATISS